jgi:sugar/nucleoside kinase (ribokinase family)
MRLLGVGDNVVDRYHDLGLMFPGGNALNVAVAGARAGAEAAYLGVVGNDRAGETILAGLRAEGVDTSHVRVVPGASAHGDVSLVEGDRVFAGSDVGVSRFVPSPDDLAWAGTFELVHTGDCSMLEDQVAELARVTPVSFDFSVQRDPAYVEPLLPHVAIACFSAADLTEEAALDLLATAVAKGPRLALATRGAAPAILHDGQRTWRQAVIPTKVVDTLGAGDFFIGRFIVGVIGGEDTAVSLAAAAHAAAVTCGIHGAFGHGSPLAPEHAAPSPSEALPS